MTKPALPSDLTPILDALVDGAKRALTEDFLAAYLVGSFALGAGDQHSDVDFFIVTHREPKVDALRELHRTLPDLPSHWAQHLEGSYVSLETLQNRGSGGWLYVDNGSRELVTSEHDNTAVMRWVLRNHGIALAGPPAATLIEAVSADELKAESALAATRLVASLREHPEIVDDAWAQTHVVTTVSRILFTADQGTVTSKLAALDWAAKRLTDWTDVIRRAAADRPDPWSRVGHPAHPQLAERTRELVAALPSILNS